ncbi:MAG TPA: hypothetical protein PK435_07315 [Thermoanaerobaculaceae bacterium]|nr:hypothetical protein [Thermoanaerobaculaceae bacterium]
MSAWVAVLSVLVLGWGLIRFANAGAGVPGAVTGVVVWGTLGQVVWMAALDLAGVRWSLPLLLIPGAIAAAAGLARRRVPGRVTGSARAALASGEWRWGGLAAVAALAHAVVIAAVPAFGWDFRYIWGLKARVFALAGGHDPAWLAWPPYAFAHPTYPPLWCDLLAGGAITGATAAATASAWQAVLVIALAAGCWECSRGAAAPARALAAAAGAWSPVVFSPRYSGYAEALLALLVVMAFCGLDRIAGGELDAMPTLVASVVVLTLVKDEGAALALGVALATLRLIGLRRAVPVLCAFAVPFACWHLFLVNAGVRQSAYLLSIPLALRHLAELPAALAAAVKPKLAAVALAWGLAAPGLRGPRLHGVRLALAVWGLAAAGAYLTTTANLTWHLFTSLDRVLAAPLPTILALSLRAGWPAPALGHGKPKAPSGRGFALDTAGDGL